jgi:hypothetical protein
LMVTSRGFAPWVSDPTVAGEAGCVGVSWGTATAYPRRRRSADDIYADIVVSCVSLHVCG